jgi:hypothetical protein
MWLSRIRLDWHVKMTCVFEYVKVTCFFISKDKLEKYFIKKNMCISHVIKKSCVFQCEETHVIIID